VSHDTVHLRIKGLLIVEELRLKREAQHVSWDYKSPDEILGSILLYRVCNSATQIIRTILGVPSANHGQTVTGFGGNLLGKPGVET
jgi:hypothetical protein